MISDYDVVFRLVVASVLGALVGLERELRDHPAGLRTHTLVSVGACLFTLASVYGFLGPEGVSLAGVDPTRIAAQIVVGIGFIGGGAILRHGGSVRGLTTATSLWVTAAVGLAVGSGFYVGAGTAVGIVLVSLALKPVERRLQRPGRRNGGED